MFVKFVFTRDNNVLAKKSLGLIIIVMTKKFRLVLPVFLFCFTARPGLYARESILAAYERNFIRADLPGKMEILRDAAADDRAEEFIGRLYDSVLRFSLQNADILWDDPDFIALTVLAVRGAGTAGYKPSVNTLWNVFTSFLDASIRVEVLRSLPVLAQGNSELVKNLIRFVFGQNDLFNAGISPDYIILSACVAALGALKDSSAFPVLFTLMRSGHPPPIPAEAEAALAELPWDDGRYFIELIRRGDYSDKLAALKVGINNRTYNDAQRGTVAEAALEAGLDFFPENGKDEEILDELRYEAVRYIRDLKWNHAAPLVIRHFYQVRQGYEDGIVDKERFLEAVSCLGAMGTPEAAQVLSLQLGYFNLRMEQRGDYDDSIILEAVNALGNLGDKVAFEHLMTIGYHLSYPEHIQNAAREAIVRLKW
jgi:HEAT repeat protein